VRHTAICLRSGRLVGFAPSSFFREALPFRRAHGGHRFPRTEPRNDKILISWAINWGWNRRYALTGQWDVRWNANDASLSRIYTAQLIGLMPDVILTAPTINLTVIQEATSTVPVVFVQVSDPVVQGFVRNVRQPGGNLSGFSAYEFSIGGKWLGLLKEVAPGLARVAVMFNPGEAPQTKFFLQVIDAIAPSLGVQAITVPVQETADIEPALARFASQPNGGLILPTGIFIQSRYPLIADLAARYRLPSIAAVSGFAENGGLMDYGAQIDLIGQYRQAAGYVDRILKGATLGDLPVQGRDKYTFVINLKTAKMLGLTVPPGLIAIADEVIE
jgi:putative tryptophan/tyrosine transport system substrate-binding protein